MPMIILGIVVVLPLMIALYTMGQEYAGQVAHVDEVIRCRSIALSVFNTLQARIRERPYSERVFANSPYREYERNFQGGEYELFVIDAPGKPMQADIYILVNYRRVRKLFFWRILIESSILDAIGKIIQIIYTNPDYAVYGNGEPASSANDYINTILRERKNNRKAAAAKSVLIKPKGSLSEIADILDMPDSSRIDDSIDPAASLITDVPPLEPPPKFSKTVEVFAEDFESAPIGPFTFPSGWETEPEGNGNTHITAEKTAGGLKAIKFSTPMPTVPQSVHHAAMVTLSIEGEPERIVLEADICVKDATSGASMGLLSNPLDYFKGTSVNGVNQTAYAMYTTPGSDMKYGAVENVQNDRWYNYRQVLDHVNGKTELYVDGRLISSEQFPHSNKPAQLKFGTSRVMLNPGTGQAESGQVVYYDNIKITAEYKE